MAGEGSDIRVKLSAQGVEEVVRALQRVRNEARKTGKDSAKDFSLLNSAVSDFKSLLPDLSVAAAVTGIGAMVKKALDTADAMGKLSQKTGVSTEALSVLNIAAKTADASFEQVSGGIIKFNKTMGDLDRGSADAGDAVKRLLGNSKALNGLNTEQRLLKVVDAIGKMESGYKKTRAAQDFFGKSGAELIPLMNDLSNGGFEKLKEKALAAGKIIDTDFAEAAQRANDNMVRLKGVATGLTTQFAAGLAPAIGDAAEALTKAMTTSDANAFRKLGEGAGWVIKSITTGFLTVGKTVGMVMALVAESIDGLIEKAKLGGQALKAMATFDLKTLESIGAKRFELQKDQLKRRKEIMKFYWDDLGKPLMDVWDAPPAEKTGGSDTGGNEPPSDAEMKAIAKAYESLLKARLQNELALTQKYLSLQEQEAKQAYEDGKTSLAAYYAERRRIVEDSYDKEIKALEDDWDRVAKSKTAGRAEEIQKAQELEEIDAKIAQKRLDRQMKLNDLGAEERAKLLEIAQKQRDMENELLELEGRGLEAALNGIRQRAAEMKKAGLDPALVDKLAGALEKQATFRDMQNRGGLLQSQLGLEKSNIDNAQAGGQLFPFQAAEAYNAAVQRALPNMRALADEMERAATTDEERLAAAQFRAEIDSLAVSANKSAQEMANFKDAVESSLTSDLTNFFSKGIDEAKNFGDAMRSLALSVVESLRQIAAQMLATYATQQLLSLFGGASTAANSSGGSLAPSTAYAASGGLILGPGTGTSDSIPARLSNGEFVVRAAVVRRPGVLEHLVALNAGMGRPMLRGSRQVPRYADGGLVRAEELRGQDGAIVVGLEEGVIVRKMLGAMRSKEGQRIQIENLGRNQKRASRALGR